MNETMPQPPRSGMAWPYVLGCAVILLALALFALYAGTPAIPNPPTQKVDQRVTTTEPGRDDVSTLRRLVDDAPSRLMVGEI